jgi:hypothetical protein
MSGSFFFVSGGFAFCHEIRSLSGKFSLLQARVDLRLQKVSFWL